uniref:Uncharacterized protein n=1 Tax=Arundo donax TaxID=35708 RepID=A0A0A9FVI6_ARUDO
MSQGLISFFLLCPQFSSLVCCLIGYILLCLLIRFNELVS